MSEHPWIDFDGDGHADNYDTVQDDHGHYAFAHHDSHGHVELIRPQGIGGFPQSPGHTSQHVFAQ